jgi:adenosylcobinamide-GDP ribazoletransferase
MSPRPLLIALQFLTRLPVRLERAPAPVELGRSLLWYPLVGVLLGLLLWALDIALGHSPLLLRAALLLTVWVLTTGAMHIDGLADSADAWMGGHGNREQILAIMKDPHVGAGAVTAVVLVLLLKVAALCAVLDAAHRTDLLLGPLLARSAIPALFASTPYVRTDGIASAHATNLSRLAAVAVVAATLGTIALVFGRIGIVAIAATVLAFILVRQALMQRLGGTTGDTAGAMIELLETLVLIVLGVWRYA